MSSSDIDARDIVSEESSMQAISLAQVALRQAFAKSERLHSATLTQFSSMINLSSRLLSARSQLEEQLRQRERDVEQLRKDLRSKENVINRLQAEVYEIESGRDMVQEEYESFIRRQQEESFKRMESARWLPRDGSKVVTDLDRIKREMRSWAKGMSVKDMSLLQTLDGMDTAALMKDLSCVVLLENNQLPRGLSTPKSASLLLNALLAHDVYTTIFRNPFFFLNDGLGHTLPRARLDDTMNKIYQLAQASNQQDAHIWRSQMLRLLLPPLQHKSHDGEKELYSWTRGIIANVAKQQASNFMASSARHFINNDAKPGYAQKLEAIYQEAATLSYQLWTRRTTMRCYTLHELGRPTFDSDNPQLVPHPLVRYDEHDDFLKDKPITVIVHPLLKFFGTEEAQDYEEGKMWAPAEVWLNSR